MHPPDLKPLEVTRLDSCDSTNRWLLAAAEAGAPAGSVVVTREQTSGRGRRGRGWIAAPGHTLTFSLLWTFPADPAALNGLPLAVGVAIMRALSDVRLGEHHTGFRVGLKWPNDILLRRPERADAKMGGILVESMVRRTQNGGREMAVVIGIGLNCLSSAVVDAVVTDQAVAALDDLLATRVHCAPDTVLPVILEALQHTLRELSDGGFGVLRDAWQAAHLWKGEAVRISEAGKPLLDGVVRGVDADGALCIATPSGIERVVAGDVRLRRV